MSGRLENVLLAVEEERERIEFARAALASREATLAEIERLALGAGTEQASERTAGGPAPALSAAAVDGVASPDAPPASPSLAPGPAEDPHRDGGTILPDAAVPGPTVLCAVHGERISLDGECWRCAAEAEGEELGRAPSEAEGAKWREQADPEPVPSAETEGARSGASAQEDEPEVLGFTEAEIVSRVLAYVEANEGARLGEVRDACSDGRREIWPGVVADVISLLRAQGRLRVEGRTAGIRLYLPDAEEETHEPPSAPVSTNGAAPTAPTDTGPEGPEKAPEDLEPHEGAAEPEASAATGIPSPNADSTERLPAAGSPAPMYEGDSYAEWLESAAPRQLDLATRVIGFVEEHPGAMPAEIRAAVFSETNYAFSTVQGMLKTLKRLRALRTEGKTNGTRYYTTAQLDAIERERVSGRSRNGAEVKRLREQIFDLLAFRSGEDHEDPTEPEIADALAADREDVAEATVRMLADDEVEIIGGRYRLVRQAAGRV